MRKKIIYCFMFLFLVSCNNDWSNSTDIWGKWLNSKAQKGIRISQVLDISEMVEKDKELKTFQCEYKWDVYYDEEIQVKESHAGIVDVFYKDYTAVFQPDDENKEPLVMYFKLGIKGYYLTLSEDTTFGTRFVKHGSEE